MASYKLLPTSDNVREIHGPGRQLLQTNDDSNYHGLRQIGSTLSGPRRAPPSDFQAPYKPTNLWRDHALKSSPTLTVSDQEPTESPEQIAAREELIEKLEKRNLECRTRLDEINAVWSAKASVLEEEIKLTDKELQIQKEELNVVLTPPEPPPPRPGPKSLAFVDGSMFMGICTIVIVINLAMMIYELQHPSYADKWWAIDQAFMAFYVLELLLKIIYMQKHCFIGPVSVVWWNWLDAIIVVSGVLDQWVQPVLKSTGMLARGDEKEGDMGPAQMLRMLRLARLARILKIVKVFLQSDLSWTEGAKFQTFIMGVIGINSLLMGFETDMPDFGGWYYIEQVLLVIYSFELAVRLKRWGGAFFCNQDWFWNYMDFIIVVGGQIDQWMLPAVVIVQTLVTGKKAKPLQLGQAMVLLRMARLLRILRLVRLIKNIPPLFNLIVGIIQAMQGMSYVLILTIVMLYAFAILAVRLIGQGMIFGGKTPDEIKGIFDDVPDSMFVLFKVMNGDQGTVGPLLEMMPIMKLIFALFMIMTSWAILSILTAVVSENMIAVTERSREEREAIRAQEAEGRTIVKLTEIFQALDDNDSGDIDEREFTRLLVDPDRVDELCEAAGVRKYDIVELFDVVSTRDQDNLIDCSDQARTMKYKDFISGLRKNSEPITMRSIMRMEKRMRDIYLSQCEERSAMQWLIEQIAAKKALKTGVKDDIPRLPEINWSNKPIIGGIEVDPYDEALATADLQIKRLQ